MEKFLLSFLVSVILAGLLIFGVRQSALEHGLKVPDIEFVGRKVVGKRGRVFFEPTREEVQGGQAYLVEAVIHIEENDQLILDFKYFVPNDGRRYKISYTPGSVDFINDEIVLKPGAGIKRVGVYYKPSFRLKHTYQGETLTFRINQQSPNGDQEPVFSRRVVFEKEWRRPVRLIFPGINDSEFRTIGDGNGDNQFLKR